jgi:hypothetical protein
MSSRSITQMSNCAVAQTGKCGVGPHATIGGKRSLQRAKQHQASKPATVRVRVEAAFYKEILDHHGFPHHCELMRVSGESTELDEAIASAILEFEETQCVSHWSIAADGYEVETRPATV